MLIQNFIMDLIYHLIEQKPKYFLPCLTNTKNLDMKNKNAINEIGKLWKQITEEEKVPK